MNRIWIRLLALFIGCSICRAGAPVAQVVWVKGRVTVVRVGQQAPEVVAEGAKLWTGDRLEARPGADAGVLVDGVTRNLSALPDARWTAGPKFEPPARSVLDTLKENILGKEPARRSGGADFAAKQKAKAAALEQLRNESGIAAAFGNNQAFVRMPTGGMGIASGSGPVPVNASLSTGAPAARVRPLSGKVVADRLLFEFPEGTWHLTVTAEGASKPVHSGLVVGTSATIPVWTLVPEKSYVWTLKPNQAGAGFQGRFTVATEDQLQAAIAKGKSAFERGQALEKAGFTDAALECYLRDTDPASLSRVRAGKLSGAAGR